MSALDQQTLRQLEGISLDKRLTDKASGKDMHRPQLQQLTGYVREGNKKKRFDGFGAVGHWPYDIVPAEHRRTPNMYWFKRTLRATSA